MAVTKEQQVEVIEGEIEGFTKALENAKEYQVAFGFTDEYLKGFETALGWMKRHLKMAKDGTLESSEHRHDPAQARFGVGGQGR